MKALKSIVGISCVAASCLFAQALESSCSYDCECTEQGECLSLPIVNMMQASEEDLNRLGEGDFILEVSEGSSIPVQGFCTGAFLQFEAAEQSLGQMQVIQTFYVRIAEEGFLFSSDLVEWKSFLEFTEGEASVGLNKEEGSLFLRLGVALDKRA